MSNLDDDLAAFDKMLGIEPEPASETETTEPAPEAPAEALPEPEAEAEAPKERPRDEQGRFAKAEEEPQEERLYAGKFKSEEELERAYTELQSLMGKRLEPEELKEALVGLNALPDRIAEKLTSYEDEGPVEVDASWFKEQLDEDPARLSYWAKDNAPHLLGRAVQAWGEEDPFAAAQFVTDVRLAAQRQEFEQMLTQHTSRYEQVYRQTSISDAFAAVAAEIPDIAEYAKEIMEAAKFAPEVKRGLTSESADERERSVKALYFLARGMKGGLQPQATAPAETVQDPALSTAQAAAEAVSDVKLSGTVASQTQTSEPEQVSEGDQWLKDIGFDDILARYDHSSE